MNANVKKAGNRFVNNHKNNFNSLLLNDKDIYVYFGA